jgi:hypothetical protein
MIPSITWTNLDDYHFLDCDIFLEYVIVTTKCYNSFSGYLTKIIKRRIMLQICVCSAASAVSSFFEYHDDSFGAFQFISIIITLILNFTRLLPSYYQMDCSPP